AAAAQTGFRRLFRIETQLDLFVRRVGAVAAPTFVGQDRTDVTVEVYRAFRQARLGRLGRLAPACRQPAEAGCEQENQLRDENQSRSACDLIRHRNGIIFCAAHYLAVWSGKATQTAPVVEDGEPF